MPTLTIEGRRVPVGDEFLQLSPEDQDAAVDEIAQTLKSEAIAAKGKEGLVEEQRSPAQSFTAGAGDAMLGGFGPQIAGFSEYTANLGAPGSYERGKQQYEERQGLEQRSNPLMHMGGEGVGMVAGMFGTPAAGPGLLKAGGLGLRAAGGLTRAAAIPAAGAAGAKGAMMAGPLGAYAAVPAFRAVNRVGRTVSRLGRALQESNAARYAMPRGRAAAARTAGPTAEDIASARMGGMRGPPPEATVSGGPSAAAEPPTGPANWPGPLADALRRSREVPEITLTTPRGTLSAEMRAALKRNKFRHDYSTGEWADFLAKGE